MAALGAGAVLGGHDPEKPGQQRRSGEPGEVADLGTDPRGGQRVDPAKAAQPRDHGCMRALAALLLEQLEQCPATADQELNRGQIVRERCARASVREPQRPQPPHVRHRPRAARPGEALSTSQQELPEPVPGAHQIPADVIDAAHHVAELLIPDSRNERERQLAGSQQSHHPDRVTTVGLHPITRTLRDRARRHHPHIDPTLARCARQPEPRRARLIHRQHRRRQPR